MMESIYFTLTAVILYVASDWALQRVEVALGRRLQNRSLVFFAILLGLAVISFSLIRLFTGA